MNILEEMAEKRKTAVADKRAEVTFEKIKEEALLIAGREIEQNGKYPFLFEKNLAKEGMSFICEVKKASPSKGMIAEEFPYLEIAKEYERAGAAAISVLTEPEYFLGRDEYLREIAGEVSLPVLRKDFIIDEYQIYEAKVLGASAVLLICSLLDDERLKSFLKTVRAIGLSALVEAHDEEEVKRALAAGAGIIGVNNRDLKHFTVDMGNSVRLRSLVPEDVIFVSESGIKTAEDVAVLKRNRVDAVLIGETLMKSPDKKKSLEELAGCQKGLE